MEFTVNQTSWSPILVSSLIKIVFILGKRKKKKKKKKKKEMYWNGLLMFSGHAP